MTRNVNQLVTDFSYHGLFVPSLNYIHTSSITRDVLVAARNRPQLNWSLQEWLIACLHEAIVAAIVVAIVAATIASCIHYVSQLCSA